MSTQLFSEFNVYQYLILEKAVIIMEVLKKIRRWKKRSHKDHDYQRFFKNLCVPKQETAERETGLIQVFKWTRALISTIRCLTGHAILWSWMCNYVTQYWKVSTESVLFQRALFSGFRLFILLKNVDYVTRTIGAKKPRCKQEPSQNK